MTSGKSFWNKVHTGAVISAYGRVFWFVGIFDRETLSVRSVWKWWKVSHIPMRYVTHINGIAQVGL